MNIVKQKEVDLIIMSTLLYGDEELDKIVFEILKIADIRFIILAKNPSEPVLKNLFYLGVRDFIFDPISPSYLLERIDKPMSFKESVQILNAKKPSLLFKQKINKWSESIIQQNSKLSSEAENILNGLLEVLNCEKKTSVEDNLFEIEKNITRKIIEGFG